MYIAVVRCTSETDVCSAVEEVKGSTYIHALTHAGRRSGHQHLVQPSVNLEYLHLYCAHAAIFCTLVLLPFSAGLGAPSSSLVFPFLPLAYLLPFSLFLTPPSSLLGSARLV